MTTKRAPHKHRNKILISMTIDEDQCTEIDALVTLWRTSRAHVMRQAIDLFLREQRSYHPSLTTPTSERVA